MGKTLILYVFHEINANVDTFLKRGLINSQDKEFIFIFNNIDANPTTEKWKFLHNYNNMHLFIRPNIGHDFQGWNEALFLPASDLNKKIIYSSNKDTLEPAMHTLFDKFVFVNSTVRGPYVPLYVTSDWVDCFTSKLSTDVKMTGISINFISGVTYESTKSFIKANYGFTPIDHTHIQSMIYSLDREGLDILLKYQLFNSGKQFPRDKWELISSSEIGMSSILRNEKKSLYSYMMTQGLVRYNEVQKNPDIWCIKDFYPLTEMMFVKDNRMNIFPEQSRYDANYSRQLV